MTRLVDLRDRFAGEHLCADPAGGADSPGEIRGGLLEGQRPKLAAQRHPLLQLPQAAIVQPLRQLRLSGQDDEQQLFVVRLDVGQQPNLLEQFERQALCFIDDQHGCLASPPARFQDDLELEEEVGLRATAPQSLRPKRSASISTNSLRVSAGLLRCVQ